MQTTLEQPAPYDVLSRVYDRWVRQTDHDRMADRIIAIADAGGAARRSCLDVCCGTGTLASALARHGFRVTAIDGSPAMLAIADRKIRSQQVADRVDLECVDVARAAWPAIRTDLVTCTFDSINYFSADVLAAVAARAFAALRPGGLFVFDINTEHKLETVFGNSVYAETFDDYAYVWKNVLDSDARTIDFTITMFLAAAGGLYQRHVEAHRQYLHRDGDVRDLLLGAGFSHVDVYDDYSERPPHDNSLRLTYVARRSE